MSRVLYFLLLLLAGACAQDESKQPTVESSASLIYFKPASNVTVSNGSVWAAFPRQGYEFLLSFKDSTATIDLPTGEQFTEKVPVYQIAPGEWNAELPDGGFARVNSKTGTVSAKVKGEQVYLVPERAK